jgi:hypothetical protein
MPIRGSDLERREQESGHRSAVVLWLRHLSRGLQAEGNQVDGSSAGAGSGELVVSRKQRGMAGAFEVSVN